MPILDKSAEEYRDAAHHWQTKWDEARLRIAELERLYHVLMGKYDRMKEQRDALRKQLEQTA